jgi:hypothetical protein
LSTEIRCDCGHFFSADDALAGGMTNCPRCGHAVEVPGLRDPFWRVLQAGAVVLWIGAVVVAAQIGGAGVAVITAIAGASLLWLLSRAL